MRTLVKSFASIALLVVLQSLVWAQGPIGYSVTDSTQRLYSIDLSTGRATDLGAVGTESELEGLASLEGFLLGVGENDPARPDLPSAVWNLTPPLPAEEILRTGITFGTEIGAAASPVYGRLVGVVASDDTIPAGQIRSRFYVVTETGTTEFGNGSTTYVDGLAITGDGTIYASDFRISDSLYRLEAPGGVPTLVLVGPLNIGNPNEDSGLAWDFATGTLWAIEMVAV